MGFFRPIASWQKDVGKYVDHQGFNRPRDMEDVDLILSKLALVHSEVSEATEAARNKDRENFMEEIADVVIRCLDLADAMNFDLEESMRDKMEFNWTRPPKHGREA